MVKNKRKKLISIFIIFIFLFSNASIDLAEIVNKSNIDGHFFSIGKDTYANSDYEIPCISATGLSSFAIMKDGTVKAWGANEYHHLGLGPNSNYAYSIPTTIPDLSNVKQIEAGYLGRSYALLNDGTVKAWGDNIPNELLGVGSTSDKSRPITIPGLSGVKQIAASAGHCLLLMQDGTVKAFGINDNSQLGLGDTINRNTPTTITGLTGVKQISTGDLFSAALLADGTIKVWGGNMNGQLGLGDTVNRTTPTTVPGLTGVKKISCGRGFALVLMNDGTVREWGDVLTWNFSTDPINLYLTPMWLPDISGAIDIDAGHSHAIVLIENGTVKSWGYNNSCLGYTTSQTCTVNPATIPNFTGVKQISAGTCLTIVLVNDGSLYSWGKNQRGELGLGIFNSSVNIPTKIPNVAINDLPTINIISPEMNSIFSEMDSNFLPIISVADTDNNDLTCKYYLDTENIPRNTQTVSNTSTEKIVSFSGLNMGNLSDGNHILKFEVTDNVLPGIFPAVISTRNFMVDKSAPTIATFTSTSSKNSITVSGSASDNLSGLDLYPYRFTVGSETSSWISSLSYTSQNPLNPNTQYTAKFEARDKKGHIASRTQNIYTKAAVPSIAASNSSSYTLDLTVSDNNPSNTQYQFSVNDGTKYITPEGTLTSSPVWFTLPSKKITLNGLSPSTTYTFRVKAKNSDNIETEQSSYASGTTLIAPPGSPANIVATATNNTIKVSWDAVVGATGYEIEKDGVVSSNGTATFFNHLGLTPNTQHTYRIRSLNIGGAGNWSSPITKSTLSDTPSYPLNINAAATSTTVIITWDAVGGATGYDIEVDGQVVNNKSSTNYVHAGLIPGTNHSYRVRSINSGGKSNWSNEVIIATLSDIPVIPANFIASPDKTQIAVSWNSVEGELYELEVDGAVIDNGTLSSYIHSGLSPNTQHTYRVRSKKSGVTSEWSTLITISTLEDVFGIPGNIKGEASDSTVRLTWNPVSQATGYDIDIDGAIIDNGLDITAIILGLDPNTQQKYRIRAKNGSETSEWSEYINILTYNLPTPRNLTATATENSVTVTWDSVNGATGYDIEIDGQIIENITSTTYTFSGLKPGMQYIFRIRAKNLDGISNWSNQLIRSTIDNNSDVPTNIIGVIKKNSVKIIWSEMDGVTGYDVEADGNIIESVSESSYTHQDLIPGTQHTYRIRTLIDGVHGDWSSPFNASTLTQGPAVPTNITASSTSNKVTVSWDPIEGATGYAIEVDGQVIETGTTTSYQHIGLSPDSQHTYRVKAENDFESSLWSPPVIIKTKNSTQTYTFDCTDDDIFNLTLSANNIDDPSQYTFTLTYDPSKLEVLDLCGTTSRVDLTNGNVIGTDVQIIQHSGGTIVFTKIGTSVPGYTFTGVVNSIKFKSKIDGQVSIIYTIN